DFLATRHIPQLQHRAVLAASGHQRPVGTESQQPDPTCMFLESALLATGSNVPYLYHLVVTTSGQARPVSTEGRAQDPTLMSPEVPEVGLAQAFLVVPLPAA